MNKGTEALIAKIKKQIESFDTVVLKEDEANVLIAALEQAQHDKLVNWEAAASLVEENEELKRSIAELEAQQLSVKLPAHKFRECVNGLLEEAIAYAGAQQLRERLSSRLANFVQPDHPHTRCAGGTVEGSD